MAAGPSYEPLGVMNLFFLLVVTCVLVIVNVYLMVKWQHPEDRNQWLSAKLAIVLGRAEINAPF